MKHIAIRNLYNNVAVIDDDGVKDFEGQNIVIDDVLVQSEVSRLQAEYDAKQYQRDRAKEYPSIQEQMDMQYWDAINGTTTWQDAINAVKAKYPKG
jgi:hypothetical protein